MCQVLYASALYGLSPINLELCKTVLCSVITVLKRGMELSPREAKYLPKVTDLINDRTKVGIQVRYSGTCL